MKQTAVESIIKFCEQMANQDLNSHRGAYFNVIKFCKDQAKEMENQQQGYSEEEVIELLQKALTHKDDGEIGSLVTAQREIRPANFFSWFNKFKKK